MAKTIINPKFLRSLNALVISFVFLFKLGPASAGNPVFFALNQTTVSTAPTFSISNETDWTTANSSKSVTITVQKDDVLVAYAINEGYVSGLLGISGGTMSWTTVRSIGVSGYSALSIWSAIAPSTQTATITFTNPENNQFGGKVLIFSNSSGVGASNSNYNTGAPILSLTTTQSKSAIVVANGDWALKSGAANWRTGAGALTVTTSATPTNYRPYGGYHANAGAIGAYNVGLTAPTGQTYSIAAVEVKGPAPTILGVTGGLDVLKDNILADGTYATINWAAVPSAGSYDVTIYENDGTTVKCASQNVAVPILFYNFASCALTADTYYKAKVLTRDGANALTGANSALFTFYSSNGKVLPAYATNGVNWNDYVGKSGNSPLGQSDAACGSTAADGCQHAGEIRKIVTSKTSCAGLTISETLNAFDWICTTTGGNAVFYTTGLKSGKGLGDLVQESGWIANPVTIADGGVDFLTTSGNWWTNTVTPLPDNSATAVTALASAGTIYVLDSSRATKGYNINANKIAVVIGPTATLQFVGSTKNTNDTTGETGSNSRSIIAAGTQSNLWVEGAFEGQTVAIDHGISWIGVTSSRIHRFSLDKANQDGIGIWGGANGNLIDNVTVKNVNTSFASLSMDSSYNLVRYFNSSGAGLGIWNAGWYNRLTNIRVANAYTSSIDLGGSSFTTLHQVNISNGGYPAINCYTCWDATISMVTGNHISDVGGGSRGNFFQSVEGDRNTILGASAFGVFNSALIFAYTSEYNTVVNFLNASVVSGAIDSSSSSNNLKVANFGSFLSGSAIYFDTTSNNTFSESIILGDNGSVCNVSGGTNPGLVNGTCANQGSSTATLTTGLDISNSFYGKVVSDDTANTSDTSGSATYSASMDWVNFSNLYRSWGVDAINWTSTTGFCRSGTCRIWDWRLRSTDTVLKNRLGTAFVAGAACPAAVHGNKTMTDQQTSPRTFLLNAYEIVDNYRLNPSGNNNGLCESNEACIYTPNMGSYQGEGDYEAAGTCTFQNGTVTGVSIYAYPTNGAVDPCSGTPALGTACFGGTVYAGMFGAKKYMLTPSGCTNSSTPTCAGGTDTVSKRWRGSSGSNSDLAGITNVTAVATVSSSSQTGDVITPIIIAAASVSSDSAADYCSDMEFGGYDDWYLPSKSELAYIYCHSSVTGHNALYPDEDMNCSTYGGKTAELTGFAAASYLASTEASSSAVASMSFVSGQQSVSTTKNTSTNVRCVRNY